MTASDAPLPPPPSARIVEVKERLGKETLRFDLECWATSADHVVARWLAGAENVFGAPERTYSWGVWWLGRPLGAYRLHAPDGALLRYRLDVIEEVRISEGEVRYRDLLLDARIQPDGEVSFEDEDEVSEAIAAGGLSRVQRWRIDWARGVLRDRPGLVRGWVDRAIEEAILSQDPQRS